MINTEKSLKEIQAQIPKLKACIAALEKHANNLHHVNNDLLITIEKYKTFLEMACTQFQT